jgi:hypothetical protein
VDVDQGLAARRITESRAQSFRKDIQHVGIDELHRSVHSAANGARAEGANRFVNGNDAANFGRVGLAVAKHLELRIDHFKACGAHLVDLDFAVKNELLAGFQAAFEITTVKKLAGEQAAGRVLH